MIFEMLTTMSAGLFAGAAAYISLVEHPARVGSPTEIARSEFGASYHRGARLMGSLLMMGLLTSTATWLNGASFLWLIGGLMLLALIPYTLAVIFPINKRLLDTSGAVETETARNLLIRWGRLHAVRSVVGALTFLIFMILLLGR